MYAGVGVDQNSFGRESLGAVAGDCVAVIEVAVVGGVEFDLPVVVEAGGDAAVERNGFDHRQVAVGDAELFVRRSELDAVAGGEVVVPPPDRR